MDLDNSKQSFGYTFFLNSLIIIFNFFVLNWITRIDKCTCTHIPEKRFLKEWFIIIIILNIINLCYLMIYGNEIKINEINMNYLYIRIFLSLILAIINIVMLIRLLIYIHKLKKINCHCGMKMQENVIYYWYITMFSILLLISVELQ